MMIKQLLRHVPGCEAFGRELFYAYKHRTGVFKARKYRGSKNLRINFGCGPNVKSGWVNVDLNPKADLTLDLRKELPFADNSAVLVYSEHFFEHLEYPTDSEHFLKECFRILAPNGVFSVGVPDTEWPVTAYSRGDSDEYFAIAKQHFHPTWCVTKMHHLNYHFHQGGEHRFSYDFETLAYVLSKNGFERIVRREFKAELDTKARQLGTLYVDCSKPAGK